MERKDQGCILTDTVLGAVVSVPGGREQEVAGGAGEGLLGPDDVWGEPSSKGRRGQELDGEEGGRLGQAPSPRRAQSRSCWGPRGLGAPPQASS